MLELPGLQKLEKFHRSVVHYNLCIGQKDPFGLHRNGSFHRGQMESYQTHCRKPAQKQSTAQRRRGNRVQERRFAPPLLFV